MSDVGDERKPGVKRVRLTGARFDGGRLPVDSLVELQNYQDVVRIAAMAKWRLEHPGEELPSDLRNSVSLTIERIDEGSADVSLAFEQHQVYVHYQVEAQDAADAIIVAAYSGASIPELPALSLAEDVEFREAVSQIGVTLGPEHSIEFYPSSPDAQPVTITVETRLRGLEEKQGSSGPFVRKGGWKNSSPRWRNGGCSHSTSAWPSTCSPTCLTTF